MRETIFDDDSTLSIDDATAPYTERIKPKDKLKWFNKIRTKGEWEVTLNKGSGYGSIRV